MSVFFSRTRSTFRQVGARMVQLSIFFCFCLATAGWVASEPVARRESASDCNNSAADGVSVTVNVNSHGGSGFSSAAEPIGCCADVKSRLTVIEEILQRILENTNVAHERTPLRTCKDTLDQGFNESGVYTIDPGDGYGPFEVYCDMETDGGGWAVFQRREDGSVDFYRDWVDYKNGFGDLDKEFWLGLDKISRLTKESPQTIRFDLSDFDGIVDMLSIKRLKWKTKHLDMFSILGHILGTLVTLLRSKMGVSLARGIKIRTPIHTIVPFYIRELGGIVSAIIQI